MSGGEEKRLFTLTAYPSLSSLSAANVSASRLASIEGNPGLFQTPPRQSMVITRTLRRSPKGITQAAATG